MRDLRIRSASGIAICGHPDALAAIAGHLCVRCEQGTISSSELADPLTITKADSGWRVVCRLCEISSYFSRLDEAEEFSDQHRLVQHEDLFSHHFYL